jgi:hypothetical protein
VLTLRCVSQIPSGVVTSELWHFMFKMTARCQVAFPTFEGVYENPEAAAGLFSTYQRLHTRMHDDGMTNVATGMAGAPVLASGSNSGAAVDRLLPGKARACFYVTSTHSIFSYLTSVRHPRTAADIQYTPWPWPWPWHWHWHRARLQCMACVTSDLMDNHR